MTSPLSCSVGGRRGRERGRDPKEGKMEGRALERPSLQRGSGFSEFSIFHVSLIQGLDHSFVQLVFTKHLLYTGHGTKPWEYNEL